MKIALQNIDKNIGSDPILKDVSLEVENETVAIIGPSGAGKSTILRIIAGLEKANKGKVLIDGNIITNINRKKYLRDIGMVFQHSYLFPHMSIIENLIYAPMKVLKISKEEAVAKADKLLRLFSMTSKSLSMPNNLSGGQKQRIAIARTMMMEPRVILFDEPISALDPEISKDVYQSISKLKNNTIIVVTHDIKFAKAIADRIVFMDKGMILCDQKTEEFNIKPKSQRARLFVKNVDNFD